MCTFYCKCTTIQLMQAHLCTDPHDIGNLSSQDSYWPPHKISWRSELLLRRYLQNNTGVCLILNLQCILHIFDNLSIKVQHKFKKYVKFIGIFWNSTSKCTCITKFLPYIGSMKVVMGPCIHLKLYISYRVTPCILQIVYLTNNTAYK